MFNGDQRWRLLHMACLDGESSDSEILYLLKLIFDSLGQQCIGTLQSWLDEHPFPMDSGSFTRFRWSWAMHNYVNFKLGKSRISLEHARKLYSQEYGCSGTSEQI